ncbi:hypothetical protein N183_33970 [Sinorhizobium sp. Sb3]|nr:hypothetical protein N183_33970 [Sinorhizobium sp. Sb3]
MRLFATFLDMPFHGPLKSQTLKPLLALNRFEP